MISNVTCAEQLDKRIPTANTNRKLRMRIGGYAAAHSSGSSTSRRSCVDTALITPRSIRKSNHLAFGCVGALQSLVQQEAHRGLVGVAPRCYGCRHRRECDEVAGNLSIERPADCAARGTTDHNSNDEQPPYCSVDS